MTREEVLEKVSKKREEFISWYHEFHQIPELGFEEKETTELICEKLTGMGIHPLRLDPTGVTAYIGPHDEIGRASCRERCRSRWSPYH